MLILNNIEKLKHNFIGKWQVVGVDDDYVNDSFSSEHNYIIRLSRNSMGAAIVIERNEGEFGYNVSLCYESYDNVISIVAWTKVQLKNKDIFLATMQAFLDSHYDK